MRQRKAFTLVEMMVVLVLTLFIMVILTQAFSAGLDVFRELKSIGDLQEELRGAATLLRNDLSADHFEGKRRLSDGTGVASIWGPAPREGFFRVYLGAGSISESATLVPASGRATNQFLHFTVKLRGNSRDSVFSATVPAISPLLQLQTTFFDQPLDARFQEAGTLFNSPWAEVGYFLIKTGSTVEPNNANSTAGTPLFALYRVQFVVVPDNTRLNGNGPSNAAGAPVASTNANKLLYPTVSWKVNGNKLYFNSPNDLITQGNRRFNPAFNYNAATGLLTTAINGTAVTMNNVQNTSGITLVLSNVVSFNVRTLKSSSIGTPLQAPTPLTTADFGDLSFDTGARGGGSYLLYQGAFYRDSRLGSEDDPNPAGNRDSRYVIARLEQSLPDPPPSREVN